MLFQYLNKHLYLFNLMILLYIPMIYEKIVQNNNFFQSDDLFKKKN